MASNKNYILPSVLIVTLGAGALVATKMTESKNDDTLPSLTNEVSSNKSVSIQTSQEVSDTSVPIEYTASASYRVPHGSEQIWVTVWVDESGKITEVRAEHSGADSESVWYQQQFDNKYQAEVIGNNISSLNLSRVAGASLTTRGFMDAINQIKNEV